MYGWAGKIVHIDLSKGKIRHHPLEKCLARTFIGGRGLNSKILFENLDFQVEPLSPNNLLIFGVGPLVGTTAPACNRFTVTTYSPLTKILGDACAGGFWGPELKFAGYDCLVIKGKARKPVYLSIDGNQIEIKDASHLWGKTTKETTELAKKDNDKKMKVVCIGPAGENLVKFASIVSEYHYVAARTGVGAVMGSKNLKAIGVIGDTEVRIRYPKIFKKENARLRKEIRDNPVYQSFARTGTLALVESLYELRRIPVNYWTTTTFRGIEMIGFQEFQRFKAHARTCFSCPVCCRQLYHMTDEVAGSLEYESVACLGPLCGNSDLKTILRGHKLANEYGMDIISLGNVIAFVKFCGENQLIKESLPWGNAESILSMIEGIAYRTGIGNLLAEGVKNIATRFNLETYAVTSNGLCWEASELRGYSASVLAHVTSTRGGDYLRGSPDIETLPLSVIKLIFPHSIAKLVIEHENYKALIDSLGVCKFLAQYHYNLEGLKMPLTLNDLELLFYAATGIEINQNDLLEAGNRIYNVEHSFNEKTGYVKKGDLPERFFKPLLQGKHKRIINRRSFGRLLNEYYKLRGWEKPKTIKK